MSVKQFPRRKRLRKGRITYRKRKQKLIDGKIIEQFYEVGSETDVSIDCSLFELPQSLTCEEVRETALQPNFLPKMCMTQLTASKEMISRLEQLKFVDKKCAAKRIESENEEVGYLQQEFECGKSNKRKRIMNKRKTVSDSLVPSDTESNEEYFSLETDLQCGISQSATCLDKQALFATFDKSTLGAPRKLSCSSHKDIDSSASKANETTNLDADDEESTFESLLTAPPQSDAVMRDLPAQARLKERRNLLRDPELVNAIVTQFVESAQLQLAISTRIDKFGFRVIRCLSLAHGVKVKLLEHCRFGWCPLLLRTARSRVGERALWEPMLNLLKQEAKAFSRKSKPRTATS